MERPQKDENQIKIRFHIFTPCVLPDIMQVRKAVESMKKKKEPRYYIVRIKDNFTPGRFLWEVLKFCIKGFLIVIFLILLFRFW